MLYNPPWLFIHLFFNHRLCMTRYTEIPTITDVEGEEVIHHCEHEANISVDKSNLCCRMYERKKKRLGFFLVYISVGIEEFGKSKGGSCCESGG